MAVQCNFRSFNVDRPSPDCGPLVPWSLVLCSLVPNLTAASRARVKTLLNPPSNLLSYEDNGNGVDAVAADAVPFKHSAVGLVREGGRDPAVVAFERQVVAFFVDAAEILGVPKSVAAIYGLCFASAEPLSFVDLNARLEISSGSISQGVRVLREVGAVKVVGTHDRKEFLAPDLELRKLALRYIEDRIGKQLHAGKGRLQAMKAAIPADRNGAAKELKARLKYLQSWQAKGAALVPIVKTFLKLS